LYILVVAFPRKLEQLRLEALSGGNRIIQVIANQIDAVFSQNKLSPS
jgi:hypothetical protein